MFSNTKILKKKLCAGILILNSFLIIKTDPYNSKALTVSVSQEISGLILPSMLKMGLINERNSNIKLSFNSANKTISLSYLRF